MSLLTVRCPHCGTAREVDNKFYRREVRCPRCRQAFSVKSALSAWSRLEGQIVENRYRLGELIGEGGFALVFRAEEETAGGAMRSVALKLIYPDPEIPREMQVKELLAVLQAKHPFIVQGYAAGICDLGGLSWLYLAMELAEETLEMRMKRGALSVSEVWKFAEHTASALAYLHKDPDRLVHRDLKLANILRIGQQWKLADFGLVYPMERKTNTTSRPVGTEDYIPPEGYDGLVTPAWDIWSFGVMLAQTLTGKHPFESAHHRYYAITQEEPQLPADLPVPFGEIIRGCLIKKRAMRWTAPQVLAALQAARGLRASLSAGRWRVSQNVQQWKQKRTPDERPPQQRRAE